MMRGLLVILAWLVCVPAFAHPETARNLWIRFAPEVVQIGLEAGAEDIAWSQKLQPGADGTIDPGELDLATKGHARYLLKQFQLRLANGDPLPGQLVQFQTTGTGPAAVTLYEFSYPLPAGARPPRVTLRHEVLAGYQHADGTAAVVNFLVHARTGSGPVRDAFLAPATSTDIETDWLPAPAAPPPNHHGIWAVAALALAITGLAVKKRRLRDPR
jgi:hypothetical protein